VLELPTLLADPPVEAAGEATPDGKPKRLFFAGSGFDPRTVAESREGPKDRLDKVVEALGVAQGLGAGFVLDVYGVERSDYLAVMPLHAPLLETLGDRILFHGRQPRALVRARLAASDYSIFLRKKSIVSLAGFPTKFGESIHFGTPVITNALGSLMRYHTEGRTGWYIDYEDSVSAGERLASILRGSQAEVSAMKTHCRTSGLFHYARYLSIAEDFMAKISRPRY
jgi:glycosyltransferase involved in cell wall biosynthesis